MYICVKFSLKNLKPDPCSPNPLIFKIFSIEIKFFKCGKLCKHSMSMNY